MSNVFNEKILADKFSKLNSTQQCIETLSHWCIFHQKEAEVVVQTWNRQFHISRKEQKVAFLYLANDILQNSKRKGNEFVIEFWKVLPAALKDVSENGNERGKNAVSRLVTIWEERKVFGSHTQGLKNLMLGKESPPPLEFNRKRPRSIRIVKKDSRSIKIKLTIGGTVEKLVSAFHSVISEHSNENTELGKCKTAVRRIRKMERNFDNCKTQDDPTSVSMANELLEEETLLKECMDKLKTFEDTRFALVSMLKEAIKEQESELENVRTQLQVAQARAEEANIMRRRLNGETVDLKPKSPSSNSASQTETVTSAGDTSKRTAAAIAAEVADKLAASTSSQQIMTSVLSTFAAEEAKNAGLVTSSNSSKSYLEVSSEKAMNHEKPTQVSGATGLGFVAGSAVSVPIQGQPSSISQPQYTLLPNPPSQPQYLQPPGVMMIGLPYGYGGIPPAPPIPPAPRLVSMAGPAPLSQPQPSPLKLQQPVPMTLQQPLQQQPPLPPLPAPFFRPLPPPNTAFYSIPSQPQ